MFTRRHVARVVSVAALTVVLAGSAASATTVRASGTHVTDGRHHGRDHQGSAEGVFGTVAAVNGTATTGTCGVKDAAGVFTLNGHDNTSFTVDVSTATKFPGHEASAPSFADVCVGGRVGALGMISSGTVTATAVFVTPPPTPKTHAIFGVVTAVNGTATPGTCGVKDAAGVFTLNAHKTTFTVVVSTTTKFPGHEASAPSFADVCVGGRVGAFGLISSGTVTATALFVAPVHASPPHHGSFEPAKGSGSEGSSGPHPTDHVQGHQDGSGPGEGNHGPSSVNLSGHHDG